MTNTVYFVRHGENPANLTREFSYKSVDYPLTDKGREQARQTATYFLDRGIDEVVSSPLKRALETAEAIAAPLGLPVTIIEEFREINVGDLEGHSTPENWDLHDRILGDWLDGRPDATFPGGEDYHTLVARVRAGLRTVLAGKTGRRIAIVAHGGILIASLRELCRDAELATILGSPINNCSITEIAFDHPGDDLAGALRAWAGCGHLS